MATTASVQGLTFGALLKRYRRAAGLSQEALAERAGYSIGYVSKLERSARLPTPATVELLADALGLDALERAVLRRTLQHLSGSQRLVFLHSHTPLPPPPPPLVDRAHELAHLERHLAGHGRPVLLFAGEPGIGKTRLLQEAAEQATLSAIASFSTAGLSLRSIAGRLAAEGITARNGRPFAPSTLSRLVPNRPVGNSTAVD